MGALGFGGKIYADQNGREWRVSYYPENRTPERDEMVLHANRALALAEQLTQHQRGEGEKA
jgi:hypothetical protein